MAVNLNERIRFAERDIVFVLRLLLAFILIIVGVVGLLFPIIPDWPLILIGIVILDVKGKIRHRIISWLPQKYQKKSQKYLFWGKNNKSEAK